MSSNSRAGVADRAGTALCGLLLTAGHLVTAYLVFLAYSIRSEPWFTDATGKSTISSGLGLALAVVTTLLTWVFVRAEWLRRWWYALPAILAAAALLRLTVLAPGA